MKAHFDCVEIIRDSKSIAVSTSIGGSYRLITFDCRILIQKYLNENGNAILSEQHIDNYGSHYEEMITVL